MVIDSTRAAPRTDSRQLARAFGLAALAHSLATTAATILVLLVEGGAS
jgi:hypothetical protein